MTRAGFRIATPHANPHPFVRRRLALPATSRNASFVASEHRLRGPARPPQPTGCPSATSPPAATATSHVAPG